MTAPTAAAVAWVLSASLMAALWLWHRRLRNVGVVDVGWTTSVGAAAVLYAVVGPGDRTRRWLIAGMVVVWSARLSTYLLRDRVFGAPEDPRYAELRRAGSLAAAGSFFYFFQAQALLAVLFSVPALVAAFNPEPRLSAFEVAGLTLWCVALVGEATADRQLARCKARPESRGKTCRDGLWRYSRHPNYFFEWLVWVGGALFALGSPHGWIALACPALMLYLIFRVTGIPATEAQALRTKGDDYRRYQRTTSAFVPWFPRRAA